MKTKATELVCSPEQAAELKKSGIIQQSVFYYLYLDIAMPLLFVNVDPDYYPFIKEFSTPIIKVRHGNESLDSVSAFTLTELAPVIKDLYEKHFTGSVMEKYTDINEMELLFNPIFIADVILLALQKKVISIEQVNQRILEGIRN